MQHPEKPNDSTLTVKQAVQRAFAHHSRGDLAAAELLYEAVLNVDAEHVDAMHLLGVVRRQQGRYEEAVRLIGGALSRNPGHAEAHVNLGIVLGDIGRHEDAIASLGRALVIDPKNARACYNLGISLDAINRIGEAVASYRRALEIRPDYVEAFVNLGVALKAQGRLAEAEASYRRALAIKPGFAAVHDNLGNLLNQQGRLSEAEASHRRALEIDPGYAAAHTHLGDVLKQQGRLPEAEASHRRALAILPDYAEALSNLGVSLKGQGRFDEAEASYRRAIAARPDYAEAHSNLGNALLEQGRLADAEACHRRALEIRPDFAEAHGNLGVALNEQGRSAEAEASYRRALGIKPDDHAVHSNLLAGLSYAASRTDADRLEDAREYGRRVAAKADTRFSSWRCVSRPERLRVGLVSGDLRSHPVGYFLEGPLACIDSAGIELIAYPTQGEADQLTARIRACFASWRPLTGLTDEGAARLIHADGVHVLLDLSGHTGRNRLPVFAWKPAPVQVSWLGYFATTGVAEMDYLLADAIGVPESDQGQFTETIWYLEQTRVCFTAPEIDVPVAPLPALVSGNVTFGCFQNLAKVGDEVLAVWGRIFAALPGARLRLQCKQIGDPAMRQTLARRLQQYGIAPTRVSMHRLVRREDYLVAHAEVDLILDTFPYPGGTTTCEALWMGVPTLTLSGNTLLARQGASLLAAAALPEWVATSRSDYVNKAVAIAGDLPRLAALRAGLRRQVLGSPLFDVSRFARGFSAALWAMWHRGPGRRDHH